MKELSHDFQDISEAATNPYPSRTPVRRETQRWRVAKGRKDNKLQTAQNGSVEFDYHAVIDKVKSLIPQFGGDTIFERDYKTDPTSYTGMHSFVTSTFFWRLDCELIYNYEIYFVFHNCPYESIIRQLFNAYPLDRTTHEQTFTQGYEAFYRGVLAIQDPIYITSLKVTGPK
jgi:hypothetical protein